MEDGREIFDDEMDESAPVRPGQSKILLMCSLLRLCSLVACFVFKTKLMFTK